MMVVAAFVCVLPSLAMVLLLAGWGGAGRRMLLPALGAYGGGFVAPLVSVPSGMLLNAALTRLPEPLRLGLGTGLSEEAAKLLILSAVAWKLMRQPGRIGGAYAYLVGGAAVGLGFAGSENLYHLATAHAANPLREPLDRQWTTVPFHASLGIFMAMIVLSARSARSPRVRRGMAVTAYAIPVLLHALYIVMAMSVWELWPEEAALAYGLALAVYAEIAAVTIVATALIVRSARRSHGSRPAGQAGGDGWHPVHHGMIRFHHEG